MNVIYYSHASNTSRFVHRHLLIELARNFDLTGVYQIVSTGPRGELTGYKQLPYKLEELTELTRIQTLERTQSSSKVNPDFKPEELKLELNVPTLFVTPTYGKFNHQKGYAENFTPNPVLQSVNQIGRYARPRFYAAGGNRNFGPDFAQQELSALGPASVGTFEVSGSKAEAVNIAHEIEYNLYLERD